MTQKENTIPAVSGTAKLSRISHEKINIQKLFHKVSVLDYAIMWFLSDKVNKTEENQKFYLKDLSQAAGIPMRMATDMARKLQDKGLVEWTHDGGGESGTYIQITSAGMQAVLEQSDILTNFHINLVEQFGYERFLNLLSEMSAFEEIMNKEIEKEEQTNE